MRRGRRNSRQLHNGPNFAMCCALLLLSMVCLSTYMLSGLHAKYTTSDSGGDNARVIKFGEISITEMGDFAGDNKAIMIPGVPLTKQAYVNFGGSESATYVFVEMILSSGWATSDGTHFTYNTYDKNGTIIKENLLSFDIKATEKAWIYLKSENVTDTKETRHIYYMALNPNIKMTDTAPDSPNSTLIFMPVFANNGIINVSSSITKDDMSKWKSGDIYINLRASVVQSNGFANAGAAWGSLSKP